MSGSAALSKTLAAFTSFAVFRSLAAIFTMSFASLLLELSLTRIFSVILYYHFGFLVISLALLGLGAGGVFAYVWKRQLQSWSNQALGYFLSAVNAVVTLIVLIGGPAHSGFASVELEQYWKIGGNLSAVYRTFLLYRTRILSCLRARGGGYWPIVRL